LKDAGFFLMEIEAEDTSDSLVHPDVSDIEVYSNLISFLIDVLTVKFDGGTVRSLVDIFVDIFDGLDAHVNLDVDVSLVFL
jgi:hypothetical protein